MKHEPGTILYRDKWPAVHYGNYLSDTQVLHTRPGHGCEITTLEEFAAGHTIRALTTPITDGFEERAKEVLNLGYNLLSDNCQHIANYVAWGKYTSPQVKGALIGAVLLSVASDKGEWWQRALVGGAIGVLLSRK